MSKYTRLKPLLHSPRDISNWEIDIVGEEIIYYLYREKKFFKQPLNLFTPKEQVTIKLTKTCPCALGIHKPLQLLIDGNLQCQICLNVFSVDE